MSTTPASAIAIVGMSCRLPGAANPQEFWRNLRDGVESVRTLTREELIDAGMSPAEIADPHHVPAGALIADIELFDAGFFGIPAREAELMDPQHRVFLECAWEALEDAGCDPARYDGAISVFGGGIFDSYVTWNLLPAGVFDDKAGTLQTILANEKDYMTARVAYRLNLRGAACNVQTGCSTSLVAVHMACQSLLNFESDIALAGGVAIDVARRRGYYYHEGSVYSPDGHCRAFDADAGGTVFGNGAGIVVLKRLEDALQQGDSIRAIVLGTAINNDGSLKVGFTAPSVTGQSQVIVEALSAAGVGPETIGYVETHGTGTALGDPIEIQAMAKAFAGSGLRPGSCLIGSVKTNIGHVDAAAGVSGLIKTVLALENREIPPTLHFRRPNPELELNRTPFAVASQVTPWAAGTAAGVPRRAGVSSFGIGGTNAHAVIQEAPTAQPPAPSRDTQLLVLSARSRAALDSATTRLVDHLRRTPANFADVAFTLQTGRAVFPFRHAVACGDAVEAADLLETGERVVSHEFDGHAPRIAFMFPGQGAQYPGMARRLYAAEPVFRREIDACAAILGREVDLLALINTAADDRAALTPTAVAQPALFAVEYALARLWQHWGIEPDALVGHSVGEYVAACLAGVFSLADALTLVAARGRLMQSMPAGAMTAVPLPAARIVLPAGLDIAAVNAPSLTVVAGAADAIASFEAAQRAAGIDCRRLHTSHAFHSASMDAVLGPYAEAVARATLRRPERRLISNVTGTWITDEQATSVDYWARHLRAPVLFGAGIATLTGDGIDVLLEVGPGRTLGTLARAQTSGVTIAASLPGAQESAGDHSVLLDAIGRLWTRGADVKWHALYASERRRRVPLPTYPFERGRHWIEPDEEEVERKRARVRANEKTPLPEEWLYVRCWRQTPPTGCLAPGDATASPLWLVLSDGSMVADQIAATLRSLLPPERFFVATDEDAEPILAELARQGEPIRIVHAGSASPFDPAEARRTTIDRGFGSVARLGAMLARTRPASATVKVVTAGIETVIGTETIVPDRATIVGACLSLTQEQPHVRCQRIDLATADRPLSSIDEQALVAELLADPVEAVLAIRNGRRWIPEVQQLEGNPAHRRPLRAGGHYLIVGGFGTIGLTTGLYFAKGLNARLSIVGRSALPPKAEWPAWLETHPATEDTSLRIQKVLLLEKQGGEVLAIAADAADAAQMRHAIAAAEDRFGPIHGVISAAGLMDDAAFAPLAQLNPAAVERHFRPKLGGLPALEEALGSRPLDFCVVCSSLSTLLGGVGYSAYTAANAYLDAFVHAHNARTGGGWSVVNWDAWHPIGGEMSPTSLLARLAMTPAEGSSVFDLLMRCRRVSQVFVSTSDLAARIVEHTELRAIELPARTGDEADNLAAAAEAMDDLSPTERIVVAIWQDVLGIPGVELHDSFLDLGGSSLTAVQVISRIEEQTTVHIAIEEFIFQTAGQLAALIDARRGTAPRPSQAEASAHGGSGDGVWSRLRGVGGSVANADTVRT